MVFQIQLYCSSLGFQSSPHDNALFIRSTSKGYVILLYVDDIIIIRDDHQVMQDLKILFAKNLK